MREASGAAVVALSVSTRPYGGREIAELWLALDDVMELVVRATVDQLQTLGTRSQGATVFSRLGRRVTS